MKKPVLVILPCILIMGAVLVSPVFRNKKINEAYPTPQVVKDNLETMDTRTKQEYNKQVDTMKNDVKSMNEDSPASSPVILKKATLKPRAHDVQGQVLLIQSGNDKTIRFEDLKTINGPDLRIYLSSGLNDDDYIDLGAIKANEGNINYAIPAGTNTEKYHTVLIWCRTFKVLFSYGEL